MLHPIQPHNILQPQRDENVQTQAVCNTKARLSILDFFAPFCAANLILAVIFFRCAVVADEISIRPVRRRAPPLSAPLKSWWLAQRPSRVNMFEEDFRNARLMIMIKPTQQGSSLWYKSRGQTATSHIVYLVQETERD